MCIEVNAIESNRASRLLELMCSEAITLLSSGVRPAYESWGMTPAN